jgi:hypothetical protein
MSKHKGSILGLVLSLALLSPASALAKAGGTDRPVKGTGVGAVTVLLAPGLPTEVDASGRMTHLGRYTAHFEGGAEIIGGTTFGHGTFTLVAANGDQLTGTATFSGPPPSGAVHPVTAVFHDHRRHRSVRRRERNDYGRVPGDALLFQCAFLSRGTG